jgi:hypothetical protein
MIRHFACVVLFLAGGSGALYGASLSHNQLKTIEEFEVSKEPAKRDWQAFHKAAPAFREALWNYHQKRGIDFSRWSWGWRLGWVRACTNQPGGYCQNIFERALADKALVVRAEAATQIGRIYDGTKNTTFSNLLVTAFRNPRNFRAGKPLFVQQRILFALHQIGNEDAARSAAKLSGRHKDLAVYWSRISQTSL